MTSSAGAATSQRTLCSDRQPSQCVLVSEYPIPPPPGFSTNPGGIASGPDGRMWFTENAGAAQGIGAITTSGAITQYTIPTGGSHPGSIVAGPDSRMWFSEDSAGKIAAVTTRGQFTEYPLPHGASGPYDLTAGPDGRIWFTEQGSNTIGAITTNGQETQYPVPAFMPGTIAAGPDGRLWFSDENGAVDAMTTSGTVTTYPTAGTFAMPGAFRNPAVIVPGPDGRLWLTSTSAVGAITTDGVITTYYSGVVPLTGYQDPKSSGALEITAGSDGRLWYFDGSQTRLAALTTTGVQSGAFVSKAWPMQTSSSGIHDLVSGPDGRLWFTDGYPTDAIAAVTLHVVAPGGGATTGSGHGSRRVRCLVPRLAGLTLGQSKQRLRKAHCSLGAIRRKTTRRRGGRVVSQHPKPGSTLRRGGRVSLVLGGRGTRRHRPTGRTS